MTLMQVFAESYEDFEKDMKNLGWKVKLEDGRYPARISMIYEMPPLFTNGEAQEQTATVKVIGWPEVEVETTGSVQMQKKELTKMINAAEKLLDLWLHGFAQEILQQRADRKV